MKRRLIIVGGGGHALSLADTALACGDEVLGFVAPEGHPNTARHIHWLGGEQTLPANTDDGVRLLNGIGSAGVAARRRRVYLSLRGRGLHFTGICHPTASVSDLGVDRGDAVQVLAHATVNAGVRLADNVLINTGAIIDHGCAIGGHGHVATGAVVCGDCTIGESVHVGAGATVIQGISIGDGAVIAAGAVVTRDVEPLTLVAGIPARVIRRIDEQELA